MEKVQVKGTPLPKGHYSQGVVHNGLIYVSGQLPMDLETGEVETGAGGDEAGGDDLPVSLQSDALDLVVVT